MTELSGDLFNLPMDLHINRGEVYASIIESYANGRALDILEIGVFKAGLIKSICAHSKELVKSYTGIDPYIGTEDDPYFASYWKGDGSVAQNQYEESSAIFERLGGRLIRDRSDNFFKSNSQDFDVIIVDGDHRVAPALRDLQNSLAALRSGGLLICDDYGNSDTPEVTRAAVRFVEGAGDFYDAAGFKPIWFQNAGKPAPIQLSALYWRKR